MGFHRKRFRLSTGSAWGFRRAEITGGQIAVVDDQGFKNHTGIDHPNLEGMDPGLRDLMRRLQSSGVIPNPVRPVLDRWRREIAALGGIGIGLISERIDDLRGLVIERDGDTQASIRLNVERRAGDEIDMDVARCRDEDGVF